MFRSRIGSTEKESHLLYLSESISDGQTYLWAKTFESWVPLEEREGMGWGGRKRRKWEGGREGRRNRGRE